MAPTANDWIWLQRSRNFALCVLLILPVLLYALFNAKLGSAEVYKWLPAENRDKAAYLNYLEHFGNDQVMMVSWEGLTLEDPRVTAFLAALEVVRQESNGNSLFARAETTASVFQSLSSPPLSLSQATLERRFQGNLIGPDGTGAIWVYFTDAALQSPELAVNALRDVADRVDGLEPSQMKLVGSLFESYCIDMSVEEAMLRFVPLSSIFAFVIAWLLLRSIPDTLTALSLAGIGQLIPVAVVYYAGDRFSAVQTMLPTLVFVLTLSGLIHLIKYTKHVSVSHESLRGVAAVRLGLKPCIWSSGTTVVAMLTLAFSELAPIRLFGYYSAMSLSLATLVTLCMFPAMFELLTDPRWKVLFHRSHKLHKIAASDQNHQAHPIASLFVAFIAPLRTPIFLLFMLIVAFCSLALKNLQVGTTFSSMYPKDHPFIQDVKWVEQELGNIIPVEIIVSVKQSDHTSLVRQLQLLEEFCQDLSKLESIGSVSSILDFMPEIPKSSSVAATARRVVMNRKLREAMESTLADESIKNPMVSVSGEQIHWRVMARVSAFSESFGQSLSEIEQATAAFRTKLRSLNIQHGVEVTGVMQLAYASQSIMGKDFLGGMCGALVLLTLLMIWHAKSIPIGICYMLPNILPIVLTLGTMAWLNIPVDMGGVLCSTIALGIAVDDTLHITSYYQNLKRLGRSSIDSITQSLGACGPAMAITTATTCVSFAPFLLADFTPVQQFAWVCMVMLIIAWLGDMILLTPLLARLRG